MKCTLCSTALIKRADKQYFICDNCGAYLRNRELYMSNEQERKRYEAHKNDVNDVSYRNFTSPVTRAILANHHKQELGLDFGCGPGPVISKQLTEHGFNVRLYDPYFYPDQDYKNHKYDYIFSCEVFEHFYQPRKEIEELLKLLKTDGCLYIMTHLYSEETDFAKWYYRRDPTHVFIYTRKTFEYIVHTFNLDLVKITDRLIILKKLPFRSRSHIGGTIKHSYS